MFRAIQIMVVTASIAFFPVFQVLSAGAFQLFGNDAVQDAGVNNHPGGVNGAANAPAQPSVELENGEGIIPDEGMNIWIPGLGVVGKMPRLDFGLDMLYGTPETGDPHPDTARELGGFDTDFAIKGTIKRKF